MPSKLSALRKPRVLVPLIVVIVAAASFGLYWFQPWKLFTDETVNEEIPVVAAVATVTLPVTTSAATAPSSPTSAPSSSAPNIAPRSTVPSSSTERTSASTTSVAPPSTAAPTTAPSTTTPAAGPVELARGQLISHEHDTSGTVRIIKLPDGRRVLTLENLDTSNGPDLRVWLAAAPVIEGRDGWFVFDDDSYLSLGKLKGNRGNQVYEIPADVDLAAYPSLTIWCQRFAVSFGAAALVTV